MAPAGEAAHMVPQERSREAQVPREAPDGEGVRGDEAVRLDRHAHVLQGAG